MILFWFTFAFINNCFLDISEVKSLVLSILCTIVNNKLRITKIRDDYSFDTYVCNIKIGNICAGKHKYILEMASFARYKHINCRGYYNKYKEIGEYGKFAFVDTF